MAIQTPVRYEGGMDQLVPVQRAARMLGVHPKTVRHGDEQGKIRVVRTPGGKRRVPESEIRRLRGEVTSTKERVLAVYGRVSSHAQKAHGDLGRRVARVRAVMEQGGEAPFVEGMTITDVASGLSDRRPGLLRLMGLAREGRITDLAITYRDRLSRFGFG